MCPEREKRRLANEIFGDLAPGDSRVDRESAADAAEGDHEEWLLENRPPHHG